MRKLKLDRAWNGRTGVLEPGVYAIPADISLTLAKCARADGAGSIVKAETRKTTRAKSAPIVPPSPPPLPAGYPAPAVGGDSDASQPAGDDDLQDPGLLLV